MNDILLYVLGKETPRRLSRTDVVVQETFGPSIICFLKSVTTISWNGYRRDHGVFTETTFNRIDCRIPPRFNVENFLAVLDHPEVIES